MEVDDELDQAIFQNQQDDIDPDAIMEQLEEEDGEFED